MVIDLDELMSRFRIASRELFNNYFRRSDPYNDPQAWPLEHGFADVQEVLFKKLVADPASLVVTAYGTVQNLIRVEPRDVETVPAMINRDIDAGYWDYPLRELSNETALLFVSFFDWDTLGYRDNRYVRVQISDWPAHRALVGKHALIETHRVRFTRSTTI